MDETEFDQQRIEREVDRARGQLARASARSTAEEAVDLRWLAGRHRAYTAYLRREARGLLREVPQAAWLGGPGGI